MTPRFVADIYISWARLIATCGFHWKTSLLTLSLALRELAWCSHWQCEVFLFMENSDM